MKFKEWYEKTGWKLLPARFNQPPAIYIDVLGGTRVHLNAARAEQIWHAAKANECLNDTKIAKVLELIEDYGGFDGADHKQRLLDMIVRAITDDGYDEWVRQYE